MKRGDLHTSSTNVETVQVDAEGPPQPEGPVRLFHAGDPNSHQFRAVAFDLDAANGMPIFNFGIARFRAAFSMIMLGLGAAPHQ